MGTMPLSKKGTSVKRSFLSRYGKARGASVFYATLNKHQKMMKALVKPARRKK
jgi:hypothetical protein